MAVPVLVRMKRDAVALVINGTGPRRPACAGGAVLRSVFVRCAGVGTTELWQRDGFRLRVFHQQETDNHD